MSGIRVIWVGKSQPAFVAEGVAHYHKRCTAFTPVTLEEVRAATHSGRDPQRGLTVEGEALLKKLRPGETVVLLDEGGKQPATATFAAQMTQWQEAGGGVAFLIGGAYGFSREVQQRADARLALSRMTFPHQLVRVIFLEQLYRALSLNAGHGYHHA